MNLNTLIIALLIIGTVMTGSFIIITQGNPSTNTAPSSGDFQQFNQVTNMTNDINLRYSRIQNLSADKTTVGFVSFVPDAIVIFRDMLGLPFNVAYLVVTASSTILGLPTWAVLFILAVLGCIIIFAFMRAVLGRDL